MTYSHEFKLAPQRYSLAHKWTPLFRPSHVVRCKKRFGKLYTSATFPWYPPHPAVGQRQISSVSVGSERSLTLSPWTCLASQPLDRVRFRGKISSVGPCFFCDVICTVCCFDIWPDIRHNVSSGKQDTLNSVSLMLIPLIPQFIFICSSKHSMTKKEHITGYRECGSLVESWNLL